MAENLKKILNIDGTDYNINAVYSDEAGKVTNPLIVKRSGESAFNFDGSVAGQTIDYVPTTGGTFSGKVYIDHANVLDKDLTTVTDNELINCDQIKHLVSAVTQHPLYSWESGQLAHLKNVHSGLSGLNVVVGTTDEFNTFKRVMGVPKLSYETSSSELYYGLSLNNHGTGKCLVGSYNKNSTYTDVFIPSVGYPSFDSATKTISLTDKRTLTCIGEKAFEGNTKITKVSIPESVTEIKYSAFDGCTALKSIILPSKLAYISGFTFRNCSSLESIAIGANVTAGNVESSAFNGCISLNKVYYAGTEDAWNAIIAKIKEKYPSNDGTARLETITNNKNVVFNYQYAPDFIDLPCLYICTDLGADGLNIDNVNKMFLKMPNSGLFVELSRSATYLESPVGATTSGYYTYETLAAIIAGINSRLAALGSDALVLPDTLKVSSAEHTIVPDLPEEITATNNKVIVAENVVPSVQELNAKIDSIELTDEKVKLTKPLKTYYNVGKVRNASGTNPVTIGNTGDTLRQVFDNLFNMDEVQPSITQPPSVSCSFSSSASDERGTAISSISYSITFDDGAYTNASSTGVSMTSYSFSSGTASSTTATSGTLTLPSTYTVGTSSTFSTTLTANHSQGNIAKTNLGNNSNPTVRISSGSKTATPSFSKSAVDYPYYVSSSAATIEALEDVTKAKKSTNLTTSTGLSCNYSAGAYIWIFVRKGDATSQPTKTIQAYSDIAKAWGAFLGGTELMGTITFSKVNGVSDTFYAYKTKTTAGAAGSATFRLQ